MRIKRGIQQRKRHKRVLRQTKGYKLGRKNLFRQAKQAVLKAGQYAYRDRRSKKRSFRRLWILQINAALKDKQINYRDFIYGLNLAGIELDRKVLAELSVKSPDQFCAVVGKVKEAIEKKG